MGEPRTWTIWKRPGSVDGMIRGPVADAVEVVERSVLGRVEEERDALREVVEATEDLFSWVQENYPAALVAAPSALFDRVQRAGAALSASHAAQPEPKAFTDDWWEHIGEPVPSAVDEGGEDG